MVYLGAKVKLDVNKENVEESYRKTRHLKTATKVYVNLAEPERANEIAKLNVDGVGLLRAEFMIANIGIHPKEAFKNKKKYIFVDYLALYLLLYCKALYTLPVTYHTTDFKP